MLGHSIFDEDRYPRQTLNDNLRWFTKDILDRINQIVVQSGLELLGKDSESSLHGRCDSFVVETDVHYPTDINLLWDSIRKVLILTHRLSEHLNFSGFRQTAHNLKKIKRLFRKVQKLRTKDKKSKKCLGTTDEYITMVESFLIQSRVALAPYKNDDCWCISIAEINHYINHGHRQIDQIRRRCFNNETIPHDEKVFSLFEDHTEYIKKGKAGISQELGLRVCVMNCPEGFILHHQVMIQETDDKVAVKMVKETQEKFNLKSCSFDKGFHSPSNQKVLRKLLSFCVLPKKGKLSKKESAQENTAEFKTKRRQHSAVESSINALENNGLDICRDHGLDGFKRYVSLSILSRNIQVVGKILHERELKRRRSNRKAA
jgi:hypothetical protein